MHIVEIARAGASETLVIRRRQRDLLWEAGLLDALARTGLAGLVPEVVHVDDRPGADPTVVLSHFAGAPVLTSTDALPLAAETAELSAAVHDVDADAIRRAEVALQDRAAWVDGVLDWKPETDDLDASLREPEIRDVLTRHRSRLHTGSQVLIHGDIWPGNVIWSDGRIAALIDWEDAGAGPREADVAITRLDLWWMYGRDVADAFVAEYRSTSGEALDELPLWSLVAALRPAGRIDEWARGLAELGRPDLTESHMRAIHAEYLDDALNGLR